MSDRHNKRVKTALLSVSDKTGLIAFAARLAAANIKLLSTGGTAKALRAAKIEVTDISDVTGFPEIMDGRIKTLHPKIYGGILARRDRDDDLQTLTEHAMPLIDMLVINLYPFASTVKSGADFQSCIENIDIGGPAMIRAAAKNHSFVSIVTDPTDYETIAEQIEKTAAISAKTRQDLALKAYMLTAKYDQIIANWMAKQGADNNTQGMPERLFVAAPITSTLRYGENPHQIAAIYQTDTASPSVLSSIQQQGKQLSYNNINDSDAGLRLVSEFQHPAIVIIKHGNPCGVAIADTPLTAWQHAHAADPTSAFGGVVACNRPLDGAFAQAISPFFIEVIIAPEVTDEARQILAKNTRLRLLLTGGMPDPAQPGMAIKSVLGGYLVQSRDHHQITRNDLNIVTKRIPTDEQIDDMLIAWIIAKHVKSNAIVYVKDKISAGIGAGQMSRVDSCRIAGLKARDTAEHHGWSKPRTIGSSIASDAFFPFTDGLMSAVESGAEAVIQPGGSRRDDELIQAADQAGITMVFTGIRHFNH